MQIENAISSRMHISMQMRDRKMHFSQNSLFRLTSFLFATLALQLNISKQASYNRGTLRQDHVGDAAKRRLPNFKKSGVGKLV